MFIYTSYRQYYICKGPILRACTSGVTDKFSKECCYIVYYVSWIPFKFNIKSSVHLMFFESVICNLILANIKYSGYNAQQNIQEFVWYAYCVYCHFNYMRTTRVE